MEAVSSEGNAAPVHGPRRFGHRLPTMPEPTCQNLASVVLHTAFERIVVYEFGDAEIDAAVGVLRSRRLFRYLPDAHEVDDFERGLERRFGAPHATAVSSGTAALICGLAALGIGPGDEVIVPAYGFVACVLAPLAVGAVPVVCDIDESLTMDPADARRKITRRTRAIMPVHTLGHPADLDSIGEIAREHSLFVIEDACQAIGGSYHGQPLGTIGDAGALSFNQHKIITAGEGGALLTNRADIYERGFVAHDGSSSFSPHTFAEPVFAGLAFRMGELAAAVLNVQLERLDEILGRLRSARDRIDAALAAAVDVPRVFCHDPAGACGTHLGLLFDDATDADRFVAAVDSDDVNAVHAVGWGHSYPEWDLLHAGRGGHHPKRNPLASTPWRQAADACPTSENVLRRTALVQVPIDLSDAALDGIVRRASKEFS
jgi:dTDP-4-amino-4,6-dideoxygalactose transaminase